MIKGYPFPRDGTFARIGNSYLYVDTEPTAETYKRTEANPELSAEKGRSNTRNSP